MENLLPLIAFIILSIIAAQNKKKRKAQQDVSPGAGPGHENPWDEIMREMGLPKQESREESQEKIQHKVDNSVQQKTQTHYMESYEAMSEIEAFSEDLTPASQYYMNRREASSVAATPSIAVEPSLLAEFNPKLAIVYAEIMKPRHLEY